MADPATITLAVRAAVAAATDKRTWKAAGVLVAAILTPFILIVVMIVSLLSAAADHNSNAIELCFNGGAISSRVPADYAAHIREMRNGFSELDAAIADISSQVEDGQLDATRIKAVFYSLFFGAENLRMDASDYRAFADCFVRYETRAEKDEDGNKTGKTYTVAVPLKSLPEIYANLQTTLGRTITHEDWANASEIYHRVLYGGGIPPMGGVQRLVKRTASVRRALCRSRRLLFSPGEGWRGMVTSEFGYRTDPFTGRHKGHSGIDLAAPQGRQSALRWTARCCLHAIRPRATAII